MKICLQIPSMKTLFETTAEIMGEDFFELMGEVEPAKDVENYHDLEAMVREVNETQVAPEERLSDNVYHYDAEAKVFELAQHHEERIVGMEKDSEDRGEKASVQ